MDPEEQFRYYYGRYSARMLRIAGRNGIPHDEMEDLLQETFLSFYVRYYSDVPEACVWSLLGRIMRSRCIDYWRKKENSISDATSPEELTDVLSVKPEMIGRDTLDIVLENLFFEDLSQAFRDMREEWKRVYVLYEILGRPMEEISEMLGISEGACRMRNSRGKRYLADYIREHENERSS